MSSCTGCQNCHGPFFTPNQAPSNQTSSNQAPSNQTISNNFNTILDNIIIDPSNEFVGDIHINFNNCLSADAQLQIALDNRWINTFVTIPAGGSSNVFVRPNILLRLNNENGNSANYQVPAEVSQIPNEVSFRSDIASIGPCLLHPIVISVYNGYTVAMRLYTRANTDQPWLDTKLIAAARSSIEAELAWGFQVKLAVSQPPPVLNSNDPVSSIIATIGPSTDTTIYFTPDRTSNQGVITRNDQISDLVPYSPGFWTQWWWLVVLIVLVIVLLIAWVIWYNNHKLANDKYAAEDFMF